MKKIYHTATIKSVLKKYAFDQYFDNLDYPFYLINYQKGETIVHPSTLSYLLQFIIEGEILIHAIHQDGSDYHLTKQNTLILLGDIEMITNEQPYFFVTAQTDVRVIALNYLENKKKLDTDYQFLHFLLFNLAKKVNQASLTNSSNMTLEEKLIYHIHHSCPNHILTNIKQTSQLLHCSQRQLLRIIKKLCATKQLVKIKKGTYQLK